MPRPDKKTISLTPHPPGVVTARKFAGYTKYLNELLEEFEDFYYSHVGGYGHTRLATPGRNIEPNIDDMVFDEWKSHVVQRWDAESRRGKGTCGYTEDDISNDLWFFLYEKFLDIKHKYSDSDRRARFSLS